MDKELVKYFIEQTNEKFSVLDNKVDKLLAFKYQIIGGSILASAFLSILISIVAAYIGRS
jgi:hypothetical protein